MYRLLTFVAAGVALVSLVAIAGIETSRAGSGTEAIVDLAGCTAASLPAADDGSSAATALGFTTSFLGNSYNSVFINNNGNVTFDQPYPSVFTPFSLIETDRVIVAPFFADVDTRGSGTVSFGQATYDGHAAFCVDWLNVGYYVKHSDKLNSFQLLLVDRSDIAAGALDIVFNYDKVQWETGDGSGGNMGLGGNPARAGYANGQDTAFELPGSAQSAAFLDTSASGLIHGSRFSAQNGRYVFEVRGGQVVPVDTPTPTATRTATPAATPTRTPTSPPAVNFGDVNCNGSVNSIDAALVLQYGAGLTNSLACLAAADVNENGNVDAIDAAIILQFDAGFIGTLPV